MYSNSIATRLNFRWKVLMGAAGALLLVLAAFLPLSDDEIYYWTWAQSLQLSYYDHAPAVAVLIRISTAIFGDTALGIRLFACLAVFAALAMAATLTRASSPAGDDRLLLAVGLTPAFLLGGVFTTPDTPLCLAWSAYALAVYRLLAAEKPAWRHWVVAGLCLGLGGLGKYTMILAAPCGTLALLGDRRWRQRLPGYLLHAAVALPFVLPVLVFNARHDFAPLKFQWSHSNSNGPPSFGLFTAGQIVLVGALPILTLPFVLRRLKTWWSDPALRTAAAFSVPLLFFFVAKALRNHLEANWPMPAYLTYWPLAAAALAAAPLKRWKVPVVLTAFTPAWIASVVLLSGAVAAPRFLPQNLDRFAEFRGQDRGFDGLVAGIRATGSKEPVYLTRYQWVAQLRFRDIPAEQTDGRPSNYTLFSPEPCSYSTVLFLDHCTSVPPGSLKCFTRADPLGEYPLYFRDKETARLCLRRLSKT